MGFTIAGMVLALIGAWVGSTIPLVKMIDVASLFGSVDEQPEWTALVRTFKIRSWTTNVLLVVGTGLQIYGAKFG